MSYLDRLKETVSEKQAPTALQKLQEAPFYSFCSAQGGRVSEIETSEPLGQPPESAGLPPLSPAAEARRQHVLALLARDGGQYAVLVEDPNTDPVILALATPDGTCELSIPRDRYDPFAILDMVDWWNSAAPRLWWRVAITEPGGRVVEVDTPSGQTLAEAEAYAARYHGPGCVVTPLAELPKPQAPPLIDEALAGACEGVGGITPAQFRALLSPEDLDDIEGGDIGVETLKAYAASFAEGIRSGRITPLGR
ncbi:MAG: hypothetical protein ACREWE_00870 [Gammaproteobacteria bacterium]